jgi:hypothetical protein
MPGSRSGAELPRMALRATHPSRLLAAAVALLALFALALMILAGGHAATRGDLLAQLQRPASFSATNVGPHPVAVTLPGGDYRLGLRVTPNRAAAHNTVTVALNRHGLPVRGARVTVVYSMPAMDMQDGLTSGLPARTGATYSIREPVLGMPGSWTMRFEVRPVGGTPFSLTVNDLLR